MKALLSQTAAAKPADEGKALIETTWMRHPSYLTRRLLYRGPVRFADMYNKEVVGVAKRIIHCTRLSDEIFINLICALSMFAEDGNIHKTFNTAIFHSLSDYGYSWEQDYAEDPILVPTHTAPQSVRDIFIKARFSFNHHFNFEEIFRIIGYAKELAATTPFSSDNATICAVGVLLEKIITFLSTLDLGEPSSV